MVRACPAAVLSEPCFRANTAGIGDKMLSVLRVRMRLTVHRRVGTPRVRAAGTGRVRVCIGHRHRHGARSASARESDMGYGLGACMGSRRGALSGPVAFPKMLPKRAKRGNARRVRRAPPARVYSPPRHPTPGCPTGGVGLVYVTQNYSSPVSGCVPMHPRTHNGPMVARCRQHGGDGC